MRAGSSRRRWRTRISASSSAGPSAPTRACSSPSRAPTSRPTPRSSCGTRRRRSSTRVSRAGARPTWRSTSAPKRPGRPGTRASIVTAATGTPRSTTSNASSASAGSTRRRRSTTTSCSPTSASTCSGCRGVIKNIGGSATLPPISPHRSPTAAKPRIDCAGEAGARTAVTRSPRRALARAGGGLAFEEGAEHPRHLLVLLHQTDEEVVRARVVIFARRGVAVGAKLADDRLVVGQEVVEHLVGARVLAGMLLEPRRLLELDQRRDRVPTERARPLGDLVDDVVDLLVLRREELVQVVELTADHVPVVVARLRVEHVLVGQQGVQDLDDARAVLVRDSDVGTHRGLLFCWMRPDRKSTRLNSSHLVISYAVFCLKKKNRQRGEPPRAVKGERGT